MTGCKKFFPAICVLLLLCVSLFSALFFYFLYTPQGAKFLVNRFLEQSVPAGLKGVEQITGTFNQSVSLKNIEIKDPAGLPAGSTIRVQELNIIQPHWDIARMVINIENARLLLPSSDPIVLRGGWERNVFNVHLFSRSINIGQVLSLLPNLKLPSHPEGRLTDFEADITGDFSDLRINTKFMIEQLSYEDIDLFNSEAAGRLVLKDLDVRPGLTGEIVLKQGVLSLKQINIQLHEGKIVYYGDMSKPSFSFQGHSSVDEVKINVKFEGTKEEPVLQLTSIPPMPSERLLLMLATNKSWQDLDKLVFQNQLSADLVKDIVDFSVFHGSGGKIAQQFGIKNLNLNLDKDSRGLKIRKGISKNLDMGYEIQQKKTIEGTGQIKQKVSGNIKVTEQVSVDMEREIRDSQQQALEDNPQDAGPEEAILLKYKKNF